MVLINCYRENSKEAIIRKSLQIVKIVSKSQESSREENLKSMVNSIILAAGLSKNMHSL